VIVGAHKRITENLFKELIKAKISQVRAALADSRALIASPTSLTARPGEVLLEANKPLTAELWQAFAEGGITEVDVFFPSVTISVWYSRARWTRMPSVLRRKR